MSFTGTLHLPGEPGFEQAAVGRVFNARRPERRPAAVLEAATEADVVAGVRLARERGWQVAIRSGGHSWAAWSVREDALLIDLGGLRELEIGDDGGVRAGPAIRGADLAPALAARGRIFPGGHCPTVGIGGFLLQGGQGWNCRGWGWGAQYVEAIDVVCADGELRHASETENAELLWAARGAGPGYFGVVTRFHLRTRPAPRAMVQSTYAYPAERYDEVMPWFAATQRTLDPIVEVVALGVTVPFLHDGPLLLVRGVAMTDTPEAGHAALAPLETCPIVDDALVRVVAEPTSIENEFVDQYRANPEDHRYGVDNAWLSVPDEVSVPLLRTAFTELPNAKSFSLWYSQDPLIELPDMAFSLQSPIYFASYVVWEDAADDARYRGWLAEVFAEVEPHADGSYLGDSDFQVRPARFMAEDNWRRLQALRGRWDPDGLFCSYLGEPAHG